MTEFVDQMAEEIENPAMNVPRAIVTTMLLNGATGFAMVLAVLFCLGDPKTVLVKQPFTLMAILRSNRDHRNHQRGFPSSRSFTMG